MRWFISLCLLFGLTTANAQTMPLTGAGTATSGPGLSYTGLGDIQSGAAGYYDCAYAYSNAYAVAAGKLCQAKRASDSETCDLLASPTTGSQGVVANCSGADNGVSLTTFLTSTTGIWTIVYDQSGNTNRNMIVSTGVAPGVTLTGVNGITGLTCNGSTNFLATASVTSIAQPTTIVAIARQPSAAAQGIFSTISNGQFLYYTGSANTAGLGAAGGGVLTATASNAAFHDIFGVFNGASPNSTLAVDGGTASTGTTSAATGTGAWFLCALNATSLLNGTIGMAVIWPSAVTGATATSVVSNLRTKWGTP